MIFFLDKVKRCILIILYFWLSNLIFLKFGCKFCNNCVFLMGIKIFFRFVDIIWIGKVVVIVFKLK